jgi:hypothetical protein
MLIETLDWVARWPPVALVRIDRTAYASVNALHILGIGLVVGEIISSDLRTAGIWKGRLWREGIEICAPVAATGLALAITTGAVLFSVRGEHYLSDPAFLAKVLLVAIGLANVFVFRRARSRLPGDAPSVTMRVSATCSIVIWICAIFAGRWIAFTG